MIAARRTAHLKAAARLAGRLLPRAESIPPSHRRAVVSKADEEALNQKPPPVSRAAAFPIFEAARQNSRWRPSCNIIIVMRNFRP